ncbi:uncharacterized protein LOC110103572 isoform X1 [Dendrobium catenatum]|uniref:uncharacterized protein LOC110103572 isoform X1 n=1 Tax=Dendrobium catenatum TaxID=906689 RepID=UPI0010A057AE|nr:uncharacterized protein LOC110103572 isoform X1 [Dendrobium catenatum]
MLNPRVVQDNRGNENIVGDGIDVHTIPSGNGGVDVHKMEAQVFSDEALSNHLTTENPLALPLTEKVDSVIVDLDAFVHDLETFHVVPPPAEAIVNEENDKCLGIKVLLDVSPNETNVTSLLLTSDHAPASLPLQPNGESFIEVPISIISNEQLKVHLKDNVKGSVLDQNDWLEDSASSYGEDSGDPGLDLNETYVLKVDNSVANDSLQGRGKCGRRKSKL